MGDYLIVGVHTDGKRFYQVSSRAAPQIALQLEAQENQELLTGSGLFLHLLGVASKKKMSLLWEWSYHCHSFALRIRWVRSCRL